MGWGGSGSIKSTSIKQGGGDHGAQKTGDECAQWPDPKPALKPTESIVGTMKGGTDGKVAVKPLAESSSARK
jgi:hypothetical protein